ncbi:N-acetyltransferase [Paenisporosarcina sp. TG20]|uniref:GNAT family N-acetyltransferase n=1 Tax=Paenisporosarcina sp. TG20 TaxID=1211706 RepID=UPI0002E686FF|nr:GNAT family N-acetyltransferase [Paenisporosarcina sp. TG20]
MTFKVQRIEDLNKVDVSQLVKESEEEGYRFLSRLVNDYEDGTNTFNKNGEALYGVWAEPDKLVAIGGINQNPFKDNMDEARLKRFYTLGDARRQGVGSQLLNELVNHAKDNFKRISCRTESAKADAFYRANGFEETHDFPHTTHVINL